MTSGRQVDFALRKWLEMNVNDRYDKLTWAQYENLILAIRDEFENWPVLNRFEYIHSVELQDPDYGFGKPYSVPLAFSDSGGDGQPLVAIGGLTNVAQRFDFLALDAYPEVRVIALDLGGRGYSGWMAETSDYHLDTYIEQLNQLMVHLGLDSCSLLGSSLGGSIAISFAARYPKRVRKIVLNDSTPHIPVERRARRARAVGRHYIFRTPSEMFRRIGASAKYVGPTPDAVLLHSSHHKTCWSDTEQGRIYRHDLRSMLAYRAEASQSLDLWDQWSAVQCPVLLLHGVESDATTDETIARMRGHENFSVIHILDSGHTPSLGDSELTSAISNWLQDDGRRVDDQVLSVSYRPNRVLYPDER
ncbi:MAG: alpha/beta hydrolase [Acidiferrobacterales bacterium]|nr:alpha/beta hydrolase [Acidiferrobacterales bacterium]